MITALITSPKWLGLDCALVVLVGCKPWPDSPGMTFTRFSARFMSAITKPRPELIGSALAPREE
jgi:hypothetical protein